MSGRESPFPLKGCSQELFRELSKSIVRLAGVPVGFKLAPAPTPPVYAHPTNEHARRGAFATKQLWVTPYSDDEKWPAGKYPLGGDMAGIEAWTSLVRPSSSCNVNAHFVSEGGQDWDQES